MPAPILIVGQGLAGSVLGWTFEQAGIAFEIADAGHSRAASRVGAGIINPITGQRIVKSRGIDRLLPRALAVYRAMETEWGVSLMRTMRVRRSFNDDRERRVFAEKNATGELAPYAGESDADGFWIEGAVRVDMAALIATARTRWLADGRLREERVGPLAELARYDVVILCTGADDCGGLAYGDVACLRATGDILTLAVDGLAPDVILNRGHWVLPTMPGLAKAGATYTHGEASLSGEAAKAARDELERSARRLLGGRMFDVVAQESGVRVTSPDRYPLAGRNSREPRLGIFNGLGSKGALLAPWLAHQWVNHLTEAVPFDREVAVTRFAR
ncbi:MAG TPA: FAD-dependent oxidoreductase [Rariglobus sp.]|jgi:glycine/D-amino acid oxidase-like deaminating enzyme|nr:FAD-dependent oxidoreductase [Rariglobus sp.]